MATQIGNVTLPDEVTQEQFDRVEPVLIKMILENEQTGYADGILPLSRAQGDEPGDNEYVMDEPGFYSGNFTDREGIRKFSFIAELPEFTQYSPISGSEQNIEELA